MSSFYRGSFGFDGLFILVFLIGHSGTYTIIFERKLVNSASIWIIRLGEIYEVILRGRYHQQVFGDSGRYDPSQAVFLLLFECKENFQITHKPLRCN